MEAVFSSYEIKNSAIKLSGATSAVTLGCVGSVEEEMEVKTISKKCEGIVKKKTVKGTGVGSLTVSLHMPYDLYRKMLGMENDDLTDGVKGYGENSVHQSFCYTAVVKDEDGVELLVAYPNCVATVGPKSSIENGAEEVSETELSIEVSPDEYGYGKYELPVEDMPSSITKSNWLSNFTSSMVQATSA